MRSCHGRTAANGGGWAREENKRSDLRMAKIGDERIRMNIKDNDTFQTRLAFGAGVASQPITTRNYTRTFAVVNSCMANRVLDLARVSGGPWGGPRTLVTFR